MSKNKRSASGTGSIRKRPDGRWEGRYTVGIDPKTGKQIRRSVYGKTQREVRNKMLVFLSEISQDTYIEPSKIKLQDWLQTWIDEFSFDKRYSTLKGYKAQIKKHIVPALGKYYLEDLTPLLIQRFYNDLIRPDEDGKCLSPKSIKNVHIVLRAALQQAVELEFIKKNPCHKAKLPKVYKTEITPLTDQQVHDFLQEAQNDEYYGTILRVILFTGLREGEALGLTAGSDLGLCELQVRDRCHQQAAAASSPGRWRAAADPDQEREVPHTAPGQVGHEPAENPLYGTGHAE